MKLFINLLIAITATAAATNASASNKNDIETNRRGSGGYDYGRGETKRLPLRFNDQHLRGGNTLFLKKEIKQQYGNIALRQYKIVRVRLIAKTKHGQGSAHLKIGSWEGNRKRVYGTPREFRDTNRSTYDKVIFDNNSYDGQGPWQIKLQGNFKIKRVVVVLQEKYSNGRGQSEVIECGKQGRRGWDNCDTQKKIESAQLIRDNSRRGNRCVKNSTWGFDRYGLWTDGGCVGRFKVRYQRRGRY